MIRNPMQTLKLLVKMSDLISGKIIVKFVFYIRLKNLFDV